MLSSINTASPSGSAQSGDVSAATLQARLDQYKKNLADCVNCASAKTQEGKANIARIAASIARVEDTLAKGDKQVQGAGKRAGSADIVVPGDRASRERSTSGAAASADAPNYSALPGASGIIVSAQGLGRQIDTFA